ncbi:MAG: alpha/beta fold hydrolase [Gammaproteobacteria bacterium]|nr:alpha/beta fold hydrolase [Gammaproteobacteria bacterium]
MIIKSRDDIQLDSPNGRVILEANSPFEVNSTHQSKCGVLLVHGLLDCPFSLREFSNHLKTQNIPSLAILLPGHGTKPKDLLQVNYHDWLTTVRYGMQKMREKVDRVFIVGFSTGAALALAHTFEKDDVAGLILLAPIFKLATPVDLVMRWHQTFQLKNHIEWISQVDESDYAKYQSVPLHPVIEVVKLGRHILQTSLKKKLSTPMLMITTEDDETISTPEALAFFMKNATPNSELLMYSAKKKMVARDPRITQRNSHYPALHIQQFSHICLPFSPTNPHYGQSGDFVYASHPHNTQLMYGAYNRIETQVSNYLYQLKLLKYRRRILTYNPDFDFTVESILNFIKKIT